MTTSNIKTDVKTFAEAITEAMEVFYKTLGFGDYSATGYEDNRSWFAKFTENFYYKVRQFGYLIAIIPLSLLRGFWHGVRDAWDEWKYE